MFSFKLLRHLRNVCVEHNFKNTIKYYSSSSELVIIENRDNVRLIGINRPLKRNCVNAETAKQLVNAFKDLDEDESCSVGVLHGFGGTFCAGFDLKELAQMNDRNDVDVNELLVRGPMGPSQMLTTKPLIAAINGYAVAGGLELALLCDLRVVENNAIMGVFCRRFGVPLIDGGTVRLSKMIGLSRALDLILTGRPINAKEALDFGLANRVVAVGTALGQACELAFSIAKFPQLCLRADRKSTYYSTFEAKSLEEALIFEFENGKHVIDKESIKGASQFTNDGIGRHGKFVLQKFDNNVEVTV